MELPKKIAVVMSEFGKRIGIFLNLSDGALILRDKHGREWWIEVLLGSDLLVICIELNKINAKNADNNYWMAVNFDLKKMSGSWVGFDEKGKSLMLCSSIYAPLMTVDLLELTMSRMIDLYTDFSS